MSPKQTLPVLCAVLLAAGVVIAQEPAGDAPNESKKTKRDPIQSPAALPRPKAKAQTYAADQVKAGETRFVAQCGFCHGRDAAGGETGPDLTRSELVAQDDRGDKIKTLLRTGRVETGMPKFELSDSDANSIVAFVHTQMDKFASQAGGRRAVAPEDLKTGNVADGRAYFNGPGGCAKCHSPTGDLAGIATRYKGLALMQRMLYPSGRPAPKLPRATFILESGQTIVAPLSGEDEFSVTILDPLGKAQSYPKDRVKVKIDNPMAAHYDQLGKYTDATIHNVYTYLETLK